MNLNLKTGTGRNILSIWPVLLILLAGVLIPSGCVLWFMNVAIRNESLAVRQRLTDIYQKRLEESANEIEKYWEQKQLNVKWVSKPEPAETFANIIRAGIADGAIIYDDYGNIIYPVAETHETVKKTSVWTTAEKLEREHRKTKQAAQAYATIAVDSKQPAEKALALQAQARCFLKTNDKKQAIAVLNEIIRLGEDKKADPQTRAISLNSRLLELQLAKNSGSRIFNARVEKFARYLEDYTIQISSSQRQFLMQSLAEVSPNITFDILSEEELSNRYIESQVQKVKENVVTPSGLPGIWHMRCENGKVVLLFRQNELFEKIRAAGKLNEPAPGTRMELFPPVWQDPKDKPFLQMPLANNDPDAWTLAIYLVEDPFATAVGRQKFIYTWIGLTVVILIVLPALFVAHYVNRQIKITRLKNDFIATVSHELKTPLASMRALVDTLLDGKHSDAAMRIEYLKLISGENERLSRLIDNFLSFSRMERNKRTFNFQKINAKEVVETAIDSLRERFSNHNCTFDVEVEEPLPSFIADKDAAVTILLNLLDNAWKYSGEQKHITLRVFTTNDNICFVVSDDGIGMDRKTTKKIFQRFYQGDQSLSRSSEGCGLGLSIVKFILDVHGGSIDVKSQPGKGSIFTVMLPLTRTQKNEYGAN